MKIITTILLCLLLSCGSAATSPEGTDRIISRIDSAIAWADLSMVVAVNIARGISFAVKPGFNVDDKVLRPLANGMQDVLAPMLSGVGADLSSPSDWYDSLGLPDYLSGKIWSLLTVGLPCLNWAISDDLTPDQRAILAKAGEAIDAYAVAMLDELDKDPRSKTAPDVNDIPDIDEMERRWDQLVGGLHATVSSAE